MTRVQVNYKCSCRQSEQEARHLSARVSLLVHLHLLLLLLHYKRLMLKECLSLFKFSLELFLWCVTLSRQEGSFSSASPSYTWSRKQITLSPINSIGWVRSTFSSLTYQLCVTWGEGYQRHFILSSSSHGRGTERRERKRAMCLQNTLDLSWLNANSHRWSISSSYFTLRFSWGREWWK